MTEEQADILIEWLIFRITIPIFGPPLMSFIAIVLQSILPKDSGAEMQGEKKIRKPNPWVTPSVWLFLSVGYSAAAVYSFHGSNWMWFPIMVGGVSIMAYTTSTTAKDPFPIHQKDMVRGHKVFAAVAATLMFLAAGLALRAAVWEIGKS